jgi:hypothetical protein
MASSTFLPRSSPLLSSSPLIPSPHRVSSALQLRALGGVARLRHALPRPRRRSLHGLLLERQVMTAASLPAHDDAVTRASPAHGHHRPSLMTASARASTTDPLLRAQLHAPHARRQRGERQRLGALRPRRRQRRDRRRPHRRHWGQGRAVVLWCASARRWHLQQGCAALLGHQLCGSNMDPHSNRCASVRIPGPPCGLQVLPGPGPGPPREPDALARVRPPRAELVRGAMGGCGSHSDTTLCVVCCV